MNSALNKSLDKSFVVLASGSGSNFQSLINAVEDGTLPASIRALVVDRECAATARARQHGIDFFVLNRYNDSALNQRVLADICRGVDLIVCAGYLSIIPPALIAEFPRQIINIHPALLPKFGGKGMFGLHIHRAVIAAGERQSGCTVHYVDAGIDTGEIIEQCVVDVRADDTPEQLQQRILVQEHQLLPRVAARLLAKQ